MQGHPLAADLDEVLERTRDDWEALRGERLFITGGTGFFGRWLLESFAWANARLRLDARAVVLSRDPEGFRQRAPLLAEEGAIALHRGNVIDFAFPEGSFAFMIHGAAETRASAMAAEPLEVVDSLLLGTSRVLAFARAAGVRRALLPSSGQIYGAHPSGVTHVNEGYPGGVDTMAANAIYPESKRAAEMMFATAHRSWGLEATIARCFAFVGPYLPLNEHFAIGNFIRDALAGGPIRLAGDGTPYRSYMHPADLVIWLWHILFVAPPARPYNVGSPDGRPLWDIAHEVARLAGPGIEVTRAKQPDAQAPPSRYVPDVSRARDELGLEIAIDLDEAIRRTLDWHRRV